MSIAERLIRIKSALPTDVSLIAVSKYHSEDEIMEAYRAGQRRFGENIVQELRKKQEQLPSDVEWHFIGHLQRNKVKYIAPFVSMIHSIDTPELLREVSRQALKADRTIPCLLQIHIAQEETKFGFTMDECRKFLETGEHRELPGIKLSGLMCMASNVDDEAQIRSEFQNVRQFFEEVKNQYFKQDDAFCIRSWGMSSDYLIAAQEGSNMVRVGTMIFGSRTTVSPQS